ncbi:helix-turn-helix domain-containing protein [Flavitalea flava]
MQFITTILRTVILLGAVQGVIIAILLFFSKKSRRSNRLLGILLFLIAIASLKLYGTQTGLADTFLFRIIDAFFPMIIIMPVGPLLYFYVKSFLIPDFRLTRKDRFHFYPVIIDLVPQLTAIVFIIGVVAHIFPNHPQPWGLFIDTYNVYSDIPRWISISGYLWMAAREIKNQPLTGDDPGGQKTDSRKWLRQFIRMFLIFQGIWLIYLIPYVIPKYTDILLTRFDWYPVYVPLAILIYWLGLRGYIVSQREIPFKKNTGNQPVLPASDLERLVVLLKTAMETDRLYLDPALTVASLAAHTGATPKTLSAVLNQHLNKSFNEFINEYRVQAIKERLLLGETKELTIAGLAYECGFNSLPTFQRAFKTIIGQTPKEFLSKNT